MTIINLALDIPSTSDFNRANAALKAHYATTGNPTPSNADVLEALRKDALARIKHITLDYEKQLAAAAVAPITTAP